MLVLCACFAVGGIAAIVASIWTVALLSTFAVVVGIVLALAGVLTWTEFLAAVVYHVFAFQCGFLVSMLVQAAFASLGTSDRLARPERTKLPDKPSLEEKKIV